MFKEITVSTRKRSEFIDVTSEVHAAVKQFGLTEGSVMVYVPHTTAGITINENADPSVISDISNSLEKMVPWQASYSHREGNAAAHIKASLVGSSINVPVSRGRLCLGTWQGVFFTEFDGPRTRKMVINGAASSSKSR